jgi:hypothetical protein
MHRWCWGLAVVVLFSVGGEHSSSAREPRASLSVIGPQPDPRQASAVSFWPTAADLARLCSVEGKPQAVVLRTLGHPMRVVRRSDGSEVWRYPWLAACEVYIEDHKCIGTFYSGGY